MNAPKSALAELIPIWLFPFSFFLLAFSYATRLQLGANLSGLRFS